MMRLALGAGCMMLFLAALIGSSPPSGATRDEHAHAIDFKDTRIRMRLTYRSQTLPPADTRPSTSIAVARLTLLAGGRRTSYDLAALHLPSQGAFVPEAGSASGTMCGVGRSLFRAGSHAVIAMVAFGKGCRPFTAFINIETGRVAIPVTLDPSDDVGTAPVFEERERIRIRRIERIDRFSANEPAWHDAASIISGENGHGEQREFAISGVMATPLHSGQVVRYGGLRFFAGSRPEYTLLRLASTATPQSPETRAEKQARLYSLWFGQSIDEGEKADFSVALGALKNALIYVDDAQLKAREQADLKRCSSAVEGVRTGTLRANDVAAAWRYGCEITAASPSGEGHRSYEDARLALRLTYQESAAHEHDRERPVSSATLLMKTTGLVRTYTLEALSLKPNTWTFAHRGEGCTNGDAIGRTGEYAFLELFAVTADHCDAKFRFIDLSTGYVVREAAFDHEWDHLTSDWPDFTSESMLRVRSVTTEGAGTAGVFVRTGDSSKTYLVYGVDPARDIRPGHLVEIGTVRKRDGSLTSVLRLSPRDERAFQRRAALIPDGASDRELQYGTWLRGSEDNAQSGRYDASLAAFARAIRFDDPGSRAADEATLKRCRALVANIRAGKTSGKVFGTAWYAGCRVAT
jgi:hypothetical protein